MTNNEAIKIIEQVEFDDADNSLITAIDMAIEVLKRFDWHSCKEKLPKPYEEVIVNTEDDDIFITCIDENGEWKDISDEWEVKNVIYWMHLPVSPEI